MRASAVAAVLLGCGAGTQPSAAPEASFAGGGGGRSSVSSATEPAFAPNGKPPLGGVRLEAEPAPRVAGGAAPGPKVEFLAPVFGETLAELGLRRQEVRLDLAPSALPADRRLLVSFDGLRPRAVIPESATTLGDLIPEDQAVTAGVHSLLAVLVDAEGRVPPAASGAGKPVFAVTDFFVGKRAGKLPKPNDARLFCLSPTGTYHGAASDRPLLQLFAIGRFDSVIGLRIEADAGVFDALIDPRLSYRVLGLPAGDVTVRAGTAAGPRAQCVATLNPERLEGS